MSRGNSDIFLDGLSVTRLLAGRRILPELNSKKSAPVTGGAVRAIALGLWQIRYARFLWIDMAVTYSIDRELRVVFTIFSGIFTDGDVWQLVNQLRKDPAYDPEFNELIDCSAVTENRVSTATLGALESSPIPQRAVVAPSDANYGVSRIFQAVQPNQKIEIFRTAAEAREWLGIPPDR